MHQSALKVKTKLVHLYGNSGFEALFGIDDIIQGEDDEANAAGAILDVASLVDDAHVVIIHHGHAGVTHAAALIVHDAAIPCLAVILGSACNHECAGVYLRVGEEQQAAMLLAIHSNETGLAGLG